MEHPNFGTKFSDSFGDYLNVPDTLNKVSVTLNQLILEDRTLIDTITLKEIMPESKFLDGKTVQLDGQDIKNAGAQEIDITEAFFRKAKFKSGFLEIGIHNDLPVFVDRIIFKLYNKSNLAEIANDTFFDIAPFSSQFKKISLAGKEVDGMVVLWLGRAELYQIFTNNFLLSVINFSLISFPAPREWG